MGGILALIAFGAAVVNGALGYGFSSITVPLALLFLSNRTLNPALVLIEVPLNAYVLWLNRASVPAVARRVLPIAIGLAPGVVVGTAIVSRVSPSWVKLATFAVLVPLILAQAAGYRRAITAERAAGGVFGVGLGVLYSVTTISGPPLALLLNNQGLARRDFRAALGLVRLTESTLTALAYLAAALYSRESAALLPAIVPGVALGIPIGAVLIRHVPPETFRRICMSFDAWIVGFGLSAVLRDLGVVPVAASWLVFATIAAIDLALLYRFFTSGRWRGDARDGSRADSRARAGA